MLQHCCSFVPSEMRKLAVLFALTGAAVIALFIAPHSITKSLDPAVSLFFPDPGFLGHSMQERKYLRDRSGQDFQTVQKEFSVRQSDLYGNMQSSILKVRNGRKNRAGHIQSLALAKSEPAQVRLPVVRIKPDPIVSMAIDDMERVHARRYSSQVDFFSSDLVDWVSSLRLAASPRHDKCCEGLRAKYCTRSSSREASRTQTLNHVLA